MSRFLLPVGFAVCLGLALGLPTQTIVAAPPKVEEELVEKVRKSIDSGVRYLKKQQNPQGNWEGIVIGFLADMEGGSTALVTLALLNCGVKKDDPAVDRAITYLRKVCENPKKTYVVALCNLVFAEIRDPKDQPLVQKNADWLVKTGLGWRVDTDGRVAGQLEGWSYPQNQIADNSNTQYALLGLYAAKQSGAKIHGDVWKAIQDYYTRTQTRPPESPNTGAWPYYNAINGKVSDQPSISMTVAGVCGLLIARMGLDVNEHGLDPVTGIAQNCGLYGENSALTRGMNWVAENFKFDSPKSTYYNIYGIERLGRLSGQRFIGTHDWYREGCEKLIAIQQRSGDGSFSGGRQVDATAHLSTAFSLLFLSKGRTPVLVSKFAWGDFQPRPNGGMVEVAAPGFPAPAGGSNWNRKHNDTRHIVEFCSKELFDNTPLSWQVYDARRRPFDDGGGRSGKEKILEEVGILLQSPVLYLNGHGPLILTPAQEEILKTYIEEGGFIVAEACCGDREFAASFRKLITRLFDTKLQKMSPDHAILKMFPGVLPTDFPELEVLNRGCRTVAVFSPTPLAGYWEEAKFMPKDSKNPANRGEKAFCLIRNIIAYATGMELPKPKLSKTEIVRGVETGVTRSHFKAVQLKIEGEPEPAPDALKNLMGYLRDNARLEVALQSVVMPAYDDNLFNFKFMYLHGRKLKNDKGELLLQAADIESIQSNLQSGGLLFADAACGGFEQWKAFDKSFRELCVKLFPDKKLEVIQEKAADGKEDGLYRIAREAGINLKSLRCRRELPNDKGGEPELRVYPALLEGIKIDGRWVVIYSKYDVGCAIEGHKSADCLGYDKESALRIAAAVVLYSLKR
ncbi:MAG: hypothetical protein C0467_01160 [Planctomycetaceae bacterium]|nr:hypothetical protein [Planctomycetaceae bacterium]